MPSQKKEIKIGVNSTVYSVMRLPNHAKSNHQNLVILYGKQPKAI